VLARAADAPRKAEFRQKFCYSNLGFVIAAEAIGRVAKEPFERFVETRILRPLGMADSSAEGKGWLALSNVADPHEFWDYRQRPVPPLDHGNLMGAGSLYVSATDALAWLQLQLGQSRIVTERSLRETHTMQIAEPETYGLGWAVGVVNGRRYVAHSGETRGFAARTHVEPEHGYATFVATNSEGRAAEAISNVIGQTLNDVPARDELDFYDTGWARRVAEAAARVEAERKADPADSASAPPLMAFVGTYRNRGFGTLSIQEEHGALRIAVKDMSAYQGWLVRYAAKGFAFQSDGFGPKKDPRPIRSLDPRVYFHGEQGNIVGLEAHDMLFGPTAFQRA
jgi:Beta-lactamase